MTPGYCAGSRSPLTRARAFQTATRFDAGVFTSGYDVCWSFVYRTLVSVPHFRPVRRSFHHTPHFPDVASLFKTFLPAIPPGHTYHDLSRPDNSAIILSVPGRSSHSLGLRAWSLTLLRSLLCHISNPLLSISHTSHSLARSCLPHPNGRCRCSAIRPAMMS